MVAMIPLLDIVSKHWYLW